MRRGHPLLSNLPNRLKMLSPRRRVERPRGEPKLCAEDEKGVLWDRVRERLDSD